MLRKTPVILSVTAMLILVSPFLVRADDMPGELIDQLMRKQAGETVTAESALPQKKFAPTAKKADEARVEPAAVAATVPAVNAATAVVATGPEEQQPVFNNAASLGKEKSASGGGAMARMFGSLAVVLLLMGGALYGLKKWPGVRKAGVKNKMIEVLSQHHLSPKKSLAVVRVAGEAVLIGVTDNNITILKSLALLDDDVPREMAAGAGTDPKKSGLKLGERFQATLAGKFTRGRQEAGANESTGNVYDRQGKVPAAARGMDQYENDLDGEEFAMKGLREIVGERLKTMKEL